MLHYLLQINYSTIVVIIFMLLFLSTNHFFDKKIISLFMLATMSLLILLIVDSIEYWTASFTYPTMLRVWMSAIGYSIRPSIIFIIILMLGRNYNIKGFLMAIPLFINTAVSFSALFCDVSFSYSSSNEFVRGPLGYTPFVISGAYLIILVIFTIRIYHNKNNTESLIAIAVALCSGISTYAESVAGYDGVINSTGAISIVFYYLYLNTQQFKRDPLTNTFNRRCFFIDAERHEHDLTALISIDLNNLKHINDKKGHKEGDKAILGMVKCIESVLDKRCFLYRVGGDEFMILCFRTKKEIIKQIPDKVHRVMKETPYQCSIGVAFIENGVSFRNACSIADHKMYKDKELQKQ